jgi:hypothetical protein
MDQKLEEWISKMNNLKLNENLSHPYMRRDLLLILKEISDLDYQKYKWFYTGTKYSFWSNLNMAIDFIFNDLELNQNPKRQLGYSIRNISEIITLLPVINALNEIWNKIGPNKANDVYWESTLWINVIEKAKVAYQYIKDQGEDNEYIEWIEKFIKDENEKLKNSNSNNQIFSNKSNLFKRLLNKIFGN